MKIEERTKFLISCCVLPIVEVLSDFLPYCNNFASFVLLLIFLCFKGDDRKWFVRQEIELFK